MSYNNGIRDIKNIFFQTFLKELPMKMIIKKLWIASLISSIKSKLNNKLKPNYSHENTNFSTTDYLLSGLAIFHLKYKSLLQ